MKLITFFRIIKTGGVMFWRNLWLSLVTTAIMTLALFTIGIVYTVNILANHALNSIQEKVDISVSLRDTVSPELVQAAQGEIQGWPEVASVEYVSKEEALRRFKERHAKDPEILASLDEIGENPLPASFIIRAHSPEQYANIEQKLKASKFQAIIEAIDYEDNRLLIERLEAWIGAVRRASFVISLVLASIAMLVIFNAVRLAMYSYQGEIEIMYLVGASPWYIRGPFVMEGIFYGLFGAAVAMLVLLPVIKLASPYATSYFGTENFSIFQHVITHWHWFFMGLAVIGIIIGIIASVSAIRGTLKHRFGYR
jgi:cell division transport system permease protein